MYDWLRTAVLPHLHYVVTHANVGLDILRGIRRRLQFFPERRQKSPKEGHIIFPAPPPDILGDEGMGQHLAHIFGKQAQQLLFGGRQMQLLTPFRLSHWCSSRPQIPTSSCGKMVSGSCVKCGSTSAHPGYVPAPASSLRMQVPCPVKSSVPAFRFV